MSKENLMIVQGGGPTTVFNASLASIIEEAICQPSIGKIFGARSGMKGLATDDILDLSDLTPEDLAAIRTSPGASLGSSRFVPTEQDLDRSIGVLRRLGIRHIAFLGGNGTMAGAQKFSDFCNARQLDVQVIGVPKTIDNDIAATDRCPGFGSAARYVAQSTLDLAMDIRSVPPPVSIFETLGRDVGWLAASATLAKTTPDDAPHIVCIPEVPFILERFLADLDAIVRRLGWAVVVVSEGTSYADGTPVFEQTLPPGNGIVNRPLIGGVAQHLSGLVAQHLGLRCRSEKPGFIGRSSIAHVSPQDLADAELVGRESIRALVGGRTNEMVSLTPIGGKTTHTLVPLAQAAGPRRAIPVEWLSGDPLAVNDLFRSYVRPILGTFTPYPPPLAARSY